MIDYEITEERRRYLEARGFIVLSACPGNGKTTSIVKKLDDISEYCARNYGYHTGFACLSFTNKACDEIKAKFYEMNDHKIRFPNLVSTIDSFITEKVVMPFWNLFSLCRQKPAIINDERFCHNLFFYDYIDKYGKKKTALKNILVEFSDLAYKGFPPEKVKIEDLLKCGDERSKKEEYFRTVIFCRIQNGIINSGDATYIACRILENYPEIAKIISKRYPYIIVDEAQDNSLLQYSFFKKLKENGLKNLEFVGDPCQSIYRWREAKPQLFENLKTENGWQSLHFSYCRRSNRRIVDFYNRLKPQNIPDTISFGVADKYIPIIIYRYCENNAEEVIEDFDDICNQYGLKEKAIVTRGNAARRRIDGVEDKNFRFWKSQVPTLLIHAKQSENRGELEEAFADLRKALAYVYYGNYRYEEKRQFLNSIGNDIKWNIKMFRFLDKIPPLSMSFSDWTIQTCRLLKSYWNVDHNVDFEPYKRIAHHKIKDLKLEPVENYYSLSDENNNSRMHTCTIHSMKGATVDAILVFLSESSVGGGVSINDFPSLSKPIQNFSQMKESQNLIYVACSRPRQFLALAVPSQVSENIIKDKLNGLQYNIKNLN